MALYENMLFFGLLPYHQAKITTLKSLQLLKLSQPNSLCS